jgi:hypothetical protein
LPRRITNAKRTLATTFLRTRRPPPGTTAAICYIHPTRNLHSPPAKTPAHPRSSLLPLAHASCRAGRNSCQPSYRGTSAPSTIQLTIQTGRPSPSAGSCTQLTRFFMQARTQIAARAKCSVEPWPYRYPALLLRDVVNYACASCTGRSPCP